MLIIASPQPCVAAQLRIRHAANGWSRVRLSQGADSALVEFRDRGSKYQSASILRRTDMYRPDLTDHFAWCSLHIVKQLVTRIPATYGDTMHQCWLEDHAN